MIYINEINVHYWIKNNFLNGLYSVSYAIDITKSPNGIISNNTITAFFFMGISINQGCDNLTISDNKITNSPDSTTGIYVTENSGVTITGNIVDAGSDFGISSWGTHKTNISYNVIRGNNDGIHSGEEQNSSIMFNIISNNENYGIYLWTTSHVQILNNTISRNANFALFLNNNAVNTSVKYNMFNENGDHYSQASCVDFPNYFDQNMWMDHLKPDTNHDGIVDIPYNISSANLIQDLHPLTYNDSSPPILQFGYIPERINAGDNFELTVIPNDSLPLPGTYEIYINNSFWQDGSWENTELVTIVISLNTTDEFNITLIFCDFFDNSNITTLFVIVEDQETPQVSGNRNIEYMEGETGNEINLVFQDFELYYYNISLNQNLLEENNIRGTSYNFVMNVDGLPLGIHEYFIVIIDESSNLLNISVTVTVFEKFSTSLSTSTQSMNSQSTSLIEPSIPAITAGFHVIIFLLTHTVIIVIIRRMNYDFMIR